MMPEIHECWDLSVRQWTHIAQKLPNEDETKVSSFHSFVINEKKNFDYQPNQGPVVQS